MKILQPKRSSRPFLFVLIFLATAFLATGQENYNRKLYPHWIDEDGNCMNTRHEMLRRQSRSPVRLSLDGCRVVYGEWLDPYTNRIYKNPRDLSIDHVVALKEAHVSGAYDWNLARRTKFANDADNLLAVATDVNQRKGHKNPAQWMPDVGQCSYLKKWVAVKKKWTLRMDRKERNAIDGLWRKHSC